MANQPPRDYIEENKQRREAIETERKFLKKEVLGQGSEIPASYQNIQGDMERAVENSDEQS